MLLGPVARGGAGRCRVRRLRRGIGATVILLALVAGLALLRVRLVADRVSARGRARRRALLVGGFRSARAGLCVSGALLGFARARGRRIASPGRGGRGVGAAVAVPFLVAS